MRTETSLSPAQAARRTGRHKTTITRAVDEGKISAFRDDQGRLWVEPAELFRVFPEISESDAALVQEDEDASSRTTSADTANSLYMRDVRTDAQRSARMEALEHELKVEREAIERERRHAQDTIADLRRRLDASEEERRRKDAQLTHLLTDQRKEKEVPPSVLPRGFLARLLGR